MKVLSLGTDRGLFDSGSAVRTRILEYGNLFAELHIVVFAKKTLGLKAEQLSPRVWIYPTNSQSRILYFWDAYRLGRKIIRQLSGYKVITAQDPFETGLVAWLLALASGAKFQLQVHTDFLSAHFTQTWLNRVRVCLARFLLPRATGVRVVSGRIAESLKRARIKLKSAPTVLPIWVDVEALRRAPIKVDLRRKYPQFSKIILMLSRLEPEKQVDLAITHLAAWLKQNPHVGLVIVGSGALLNELKKLAKVLGLESQVKFEGWQREVASFYHTADLFLTTSRYEGYGLAIVEALACDLPVVATDVGVALEMGALIVDDLTKLGTIIGKLLGSSVKPNSKLPWPTKEEYLQAYKRALEL